VKTTHQGSCHCRAVRFEVDLDPQGETSRCNCSVCTKHRFWKAVVPAGDFRLLAGEGALSEYQFGARRIHHFFCSRCGVKTFGRGDVQPIGPFVAINVAALDDLSPEACGAAPIVYQDGRHDDFEHPPAVTSYL
jgi:hypothetical protein